MPSIEVGGQFVPLESMGMAPSTHVSVLDINTPWSRPFGHTVITRRLLPCVLSLAGKDLNRG